MDQPADLNQRRSEQFEAKLHDQIHSSYVKLCRTWPEALTSVLKALGVDESDAIFLPCLGSAEILRPILQSGAEPIFCDVHPRTFTIDIISLQKAIRQVMFDAKKRARIVLALDSFGLPCDYPALAKICDTYGLILVEIAPAGPGGSLRRQEIPGFGTAGILSFAPGTTVPAYYEGAAVFCDDEELAEKVRVWLGNGFDPKKGTWEVPGLNSGLHPLETEELLKKYQSFLDTEASRRAELAAFYNAQLQEILDPPFVPAGFESGWQAYCVLLPKSGLREPLRLALAEEGIHCSYPDWVNLAAVYAHWQGEDQSQVKHNPLAAEIEDRMLLLPFSPHLTIPEARSVVQSLMRHWPQV